MHANRARDWIGWLALAMLVGCRGAGGGTQSARTAVVLDRVGLALANRDGKAVRFRHLAVAAARAGALGAPENRSREAFQLGTVAGEAGGPSFGVPRHMPRYDTQRWMTESSAKRNASRK